MFKVEVAYPWQDTSEIFQSVRQPHAPVVLSYEIDFWLDSRNLDKFDHF